MLICNIKRIYVLFTSITLLSFKGFGALACLDLLQQSTVRSSYVSPTSISPNKPLKKTYREAYNDFMNLKSEVQRITNEDGTPRYILKSYENITPPKAQILQILDTKPDNEGFHTLHGLTNYENGLSRVYKLSVPKSKDAFDDIQFDQRADLVTQSYTDQLTQIKTEFKQKIRYRKPTNQNSVNKIFKVVETIITNQNLSITAMIDPSFKSFLITMTHVNAAKFLHRKFLLPQNLSGEITQVIINKNGSRISVITTEGYMLWYDIKYTLSDTGLVVTVENLKIGLIPTNEFQRVLYIDFLENSEN